MGFSNSPRQNVGTVKEDYKAQPGQPKFDGRYMYFDIAQAFWEGSPEDLKRWSNKCLLTDEEANIIKDVVLAELDDVRSKGL